MIDFVVSSPSLKIALWVAIAPMQFHIAKTGLFMGNCFRIQGVLGNNLAPFQNCPLGARYVN